jgi:hypothetical protein
MFFSPNDRIKETLDANLDGDYSVFACGPNAPKEEVLRAFEARLGYALPADFREFSMSPYGGIYIEVKEAIWPKSQPYDVGPFWSFLRGMMTYGFAKDIPDWMDVRKQTARFQQSSGTKFVPFLKVIGDADVYCFDPDGAVRRWDHETSEAVIIDKTFVTVFADELSELRKRKEKTKAEKKGA